jgi:adenylylsulfate kinase-like enzyme
MTATQEKKFGSVYWLTGLSGSGKSTLCDLLVRRLERSGATVIKLDGDEIREILGAENAHTRAERLSLAMRYAKLCRMLSNQGIDVAIATISLFNEVHEWNRANIPGYIEIFLDVPLEELKRRDPKKIYERAASGDLKNVAGVDLEADFPSAPHLTISHKEGLTVEAAANKLLQKLEGLKI